MPNFVHAEHRLFIILSVVVLNVVVFIVVAPEQMFEAITSIQLNSFWLKIAF